MSLLLDAASGYAPGEQMQEWMHRSWRLITDDASFHVYLPVEFTESIHAWVEYIIAQGGTPLRALFVTTAVIYPQIWSELGTGAPPYPPLRCAVDNFCFGRPGFDNPDKYLLSVNREFRIHVTSPLGAGPSIAFTPKRALRTRHGAAGPGSKELERQTKIKHHSQLHLRTAQGGTIDDNMRVAKQVSKASQHIEFTNVLIALVTRIWCFSFVEAASIK